jgi:DNA-binding ferritin-like protein
MTKLQNTLRRAFSTNFMLYFHAHASHVNTVGRNFASDHEFLGKIYEFYQDQIDTYAEFMRTLECKMPSVMADIIAQSEIGDTFTTTGNLFKKLDNDIDILTQVLVELYELAEEAKEFGLSGYVQEQLIQSKKFCWMLDAIKGEDE